MYTIPPYVLALAWLGAFTCQPWFVVVGSPCTKTSMRGVRRLLVAHAETGQLKAATFAAAWHIHAQTKEQPLYGGLQCVQQHALSLTDQRDVLSCWAMANAHVME